MKYRVGDIVSVKSQTEKTYGISLKHILSLVGKRAIVTQCDNLTCRINIDDIRLNWLHNMLKPYVKKTQKKYR